MMFEQECSNWI